MIRTREGLLSVLVLVGLLCAPCSAVEPIKKRAGAPQPMSPEESLEHFHLPSDLQVEIVAAEPLVVDPSAMAFDARGRLFVCELHGYNLEGHLDVEKLNKTGVLDQEVRRIQAAPEIKEAAEAGMYGRLKRLVDEDGDGRMDRAEVWADRLPPCHGVVAARDGVIVVCRPDILFLADRDGDGRAEVRETLFTGFAITLFERSMNNPRWSVDNWIYVSAGNKGGTITGPRLAKSVTLGATDFRFKADGTAIEPVTGHNYTFGQTMTDWGDRFLISTRSPTLYAVPLPHRYLARNPYVPSPGSVADAGGDGRAYPSSQPHPWRLERSQKAEWAKYYGDRYGEAESAANGHLTSACGQLFYRAATLPAGYHGNHFCCEPSQNLIRRSLVERDGLRFTSRRAKGEEKSEFLTSSDQWFRPTNLMLGPDGAIYIVDMYREIIEDYSAIPRYLQQQYGLNEGSSHGRLWRIVSAKAASQHKVAVGEKSTAELVAELNNANAWHRQTAQRLLVERGDKAGVGLLATLARSAKTPQARLHALHTLQGLGALEAGVVQSLLTDEHFALRMHALKLAERWLDEQPALLADALAMTDDEDVRVRLQLALSLGESKDPRVSETLRELAVRDGGEEWMRAAIFSSVVNSSHALLAAITNESGESGESRRLLKGLSAIAGARHKDAELGGLLTAVATIEGKDGAQLQQECLNGLLEGLRRGKARPLESRDGQQALGRLLASSSGEVRSAALRVAGAVKLSESPLMQQALASAAKEALDEDRPVAARRAAVALLASAPYATLAPTAKRLLDSRVPLDVQLAAVAALSSADDPAVASALLANWSGFTPKVQSAVIEAVFARTNRLPSLLDALERGKVAPGSLGALQRVQLLENGDAQLRKRATALLSKQVPQKNRELMAKYQAALSGARDATRGQAAFERVCAKCHRIAGKGSQVGPDLAAAQNRADDAFLIEILQPSAKITSGFRSYVVADTSGRVFTGVLAAETATSITLRSAKSTATEGGADAVLEQTILRKDIEAVKASDESLMPGDLEKEVSPQDVADVIAYLRKTLGPAPPPSLTLFEDDPAFLAALNEGGGTVSLSTDDKFSGDAALRVTPLQRHSPRIAGWQFRIRENPGPDEFRYLRLAWKTQGGAGALVELAADGGWPPADKPLRRYYSGKNTTAWQATEVSASVPTEWTVVTRDLWKDFGEFTLTGIAPTSLGGPVLFDRIELLRSLQSKSVSE